MRIACMVGQRPYKDFKWMSTADIDNFDIHNIPFDSKYGYFLEADLIYPYRLHDTLHLHS